MFINLPYQIKFCIKTIESNGFEAFCVGGAVRDHIMGITPGDYDITTNALPQDIINMFDKTVPTGIKHGTVTVIIDKIPIEVTTYRTEDGYLDHRKPDDVTFVSDIKSDLSRRDFTINAICFNPNSGIFDPLLGVNDIKNKTIRAIGNAEQRFNEDALRIMRAFRFSCQLGFSIEENTETAAINYAHTLSEISAERIAGELKKSFVSQSPEMLSPLLKCGSLSHFGIPPCTVSEKTKELPTDFAFRFAYFCQLNKIDNHKCLTALKFDNNTKQKTDTYIKMLNMPYSSKYDIKKLLSVGDIEFTKNVLSLHNNDNLELLKQIILNKEPYKISMLKINGDDIMSLGFFGEQISKVFNTLLENVLNNPLLNTKDSLIDIAKTLK